MKFLFYSLDEDRYFESPAPDIKTAILLAKSFSNLNAKHIICVGIRKGNEFIPLEEKSTNVDFLKSLI